jgi:hypothetical protein
MLSMITLKEWGENDLSCYKALFRIWPGRIEENHEKPQISGIRTGYLPNTTGVMGSVQIQKIR